MPIEREDGRHWCDPGSETPDEQGQWACECGKQWAYVSADNLWLPAEELEAYLQFQQELAAQAAAAAEEG